MDAFDVKQFVRDLDAGKYNGEVHEVIQKLTSAQLEAVAEELIRLRQERGL
jgi:hypothetical protein